MKVTLYIATHNETELKYFGKTTKYHTQEELQLYYHGSGTYWKRHLKKHGYDITMEVFWQGDEENVTEVALEFSKENDIVLSKDWANLILENGLDGVGSGRKHTDETKLKIGLKSKNRHHSEESKKKIGLASSNRSEETKRILSEQKIGKIHIYHPEEPKGKLIEKSDFPEFEEDGWLRGMKPQNKKEIYEV